MVNPKRRVYLSPHWHHFVKRKPRPKKNPYARNPRGGGGGMMMWVLLGGAAYLFLTPGGRALAARFTGGGGLPAGAVRLADGTYRLPSGQIVGTPTAGSGSNPWMAPLVSLVPTATSWLTSWLRGLSDTSSATVAGGLPIDTGGVTMGTPDILSGAYSWSMGDPLPAIPDLTLQGGGEGGFDFWSDIDTSGWWGQDAPLSLDAGPVPVLDLSLSPGDFTWPEWSPEWGAAGDVSGFFGLGYARRLRQPPSYR